MKKTLQKLLLMALALIFVPSLCPAGLFAQAADDAEVAALRAKMEELYGNPNDASPAARINKMQAFIMEIALHAKSRNPDFNIIPQDGIPLAYVNGTGSTVNDLLPDLMEVIDGWGIEGTMGTSNTAGAQVPTHEVQINNGT